MSRSLLIVAVLGISLANSSSSGQEATQSLDKLLTSLEASAEATRLEAAAQLADLGADASAAIPALAKTLSDPSPDLRSVAAFALGEIGRDDEAAIAGLIVLLDDAELRSDDVPVWLYAARALGQLGPKSAPRLITKLSADNRTGRRGAAIALHDIKPPQKQAVPELVKLLIQNEPETRIAAMYAIIGLDPKPAAEAMPSLQRMLDSEDFHTQYWACRTIAAVGPPHALPALDKLIELTSTGVASVRSNAADAIGLIGTSVGNRPIDALTKLIADHNYVVRRAGVIALGRLGKLSAASAPLVRQAMQDESRSIRAESAATLWQITESHEESLPVLLEVIQERNAPWEASLAFERLGAAGKPAVEELGKLVTTTTGETPYFATLALAGIGPAAIDAVPALQTLLEGDDEDMREVAEQAIKQLQSEPASPGE